MLTQDYGKKSMKLNLFNGTTHYQSLSIVISTKKTPFIECIIPFITGYNQ